MDARILVVGWSGHAVDHRVIAALGGVEGDRLEVPPHLHGLGQPPRMGRLGRPRGCVTLTLEDLIELDHRDHWRAKGKGW